ncbi:beta propeller repeat protein [Paenibacillus oceani]|uniref:Exo-alpha-sialidase n=1 Tax=Paenibacillus oceani TaxID=2772510 RepID=A0A927H015_9BACL|nr:sialidase family protein [Paenibacillus oceani]MBD2862667.1 exo-alpha-sialidase [Paenibacillus oceani]
MEENRARVKQLAPNFVKVFESPDPESVFAYSPGLTVLPGGRIVATMDLGGPGVGCLPGAKLDAESGQPWRGKLYTSDDGGGTWVHRTDFPFVFARPFVAGERLYVLGQDGDLFIMYSEDGGDSWSEPVRLTKGQSWHQAPSNIHFAKGHVYLVMEKYIYDDLKGWRVNVMAPVLMRASVTADLADPDSWTFASELAFRDVVSESELDYFGVPFFPTDPGGRLMLAPRRDMNAIGWLETNVVQFTDENHYFYDPTGRTFHLWMRAHTGGTGYAAIAKAVEQDDGTIVTMTEKAPSGKTMLYVPCPGGQMKFHILYDEQTRLYWLLSSQATDSMTRVEKLPPDRFNLPNNERHRLQLHFSTNCIDWCFAGLIAMTDSPKEARHYASMAINGDDLYVLSRSGDERAPDSHNGNFISFHIVKQFRGLVY